MQELVHDLLWKQFIQHIMSLCVLLDLIVPKNDGKCLLCIDRQVVNKIIEKYHFPMLRLEDLLDELHGARVLLK